MSKSRTNEEWLRQLQAGGPEQSEAIEDLRAVLLRGALFTFSKNSNAFGEDPQDKVFQLAEECAQEALMAVLAHLHEFRGDSRFTTWAYKFAVNIALTTARRERWKGISLDRLFENGELEWPPSGQAFIADPHLSALQSEVWAIIREVIQNDLTPRQRQVLKMVVFDEVPMDVVVQHFETNRNAIYKLLHDARLKLKSRLQARGFGVKETVDLFKYIPK